MIWRVDWYKNGEHTLIQADTVDEADKHAFKVYGKWPDSVYLAYEG